MIEVSLVQVQREVESSVRIAFQIDNSSHVPDQKEELRGSVEAQQMKVRGYHAWNHHMYPWAVKSPRVVGWGGSDCTRASCRGRCLDASMLGLSHSPLRRCRIGSYFNKDTLKNLDGRVHTVLLDGEMSLHTLLRPLASSQKLESLICLHASF
jgi:hypothetical protein